MNSGISYPIILVSTALCVKAKATIIGRYINSSIHYVWAIKYKLELSLNCLGLHSKFFDINLVVLKAILVVASSTWNNAHKCKWQNTKFTCFVFFSFLQKVYQPSNTEKFIPVISWLCAYSTTFKLYVSFFYISSKI